MSIRGSTSPQIAPTEITIGINDDVLIDLKASSHWKPILRTLVANLNLNSNLRLGGGAQRGSVHPASELPHRLVLC